MAKAVKKVVKRRRERKTIEKGAVHIRSSAAAESPPRTPRRWSQRPLQRQLWKTMV